MRRFWTDSYGWNERRATLNSDIGEFINSLIARYSEYDLREVEADVHDQISLLFKEARKRNQLASMKESAFDLSKLRRR